VPLDSLDVGELFHPESLTVEESRTYGGGLPKICARCGKRQGRQFDPRGFGSGEKPDL